MSSTPFHCNNCGNWFDVDEVEEGKTNFAGSTCPKCQSTDTRPKTDRVIITGTVEETIEKRKARRENPGEPK